MALEQGSDDMKFRGTKRYQKEEIGCVSFAFSSKGEATRNIIGTNIEVPDILGFFFAGLR